MATEIERLKTENAALTIALGRARLRQALLDEALRQNLSINAAAAADLALVGFTGEVDASGAAIAATGVPVPPSELLADAMKQLPEVFAAMRGGRAPVAERSGRAVEVAAGPTNGPELSSHQLLSQGFAEMRKERLARLEAEADGQ